MSDIDGLVVVSSTDVAVVKDVRRLVPKKIMGHRVQLSILTSVRLAEMRDERTVYAAHVAKEGRVVFDRRRDLRKVRRAFPAGTRVQETGTNLRRRLDLYADLTWCNGHYLACLADLYAFGRAAAILTLAREGIFEFGRTAPFERLAQTVPSLAASSETLMALEPFYLRGRRDAPGRFPFSARDSHDAAAQARDACAEILAGIP